MRVRNDRAFSQIDPGVMQAAIPELPAGPGMSAMTYFWLAVSAGITVWYLTRVLDGALKEK